MTNKLKNDPQFTTRMTSQELLRVDKAVKGLGMESRKEMLFFVADMEEAGVLREYAYNWRKNK